MIQFEDAGHPDEALATLTRHVRIRILNCSAEGCLFESTPELAIGTVGRLRVSFLGQQFDDAIRVVRCEPLKGTDIHHVGAQFLSATPPYAGTLRYTMWCDFGGLAGWLDTREQSPQ